MSPYSSGAKRSLKVPQTVFFILLLFAGPLFGQGVVTNPNSSSQVMIQPLGTQTATNNPGSVHYVTPNYNWSAKPTSPSSISVGSDLITLTCTRTTPCPLGIDVSANANHPYAVYISGTGTPETAMVTGAGRCTPGATTGTCTFTLAVSRPHGSGYVIGSASTGIQEALNDAAEISNEGSSVHSYTVVQLLPASGTGLPNYVVYAPVFIRASYTKVSGYGAILACYTRSVCLFNADFNGGGWVGAEALNNVIEGIQFLSKIDVDGLNISSVSASGGVYTITATSVVAPSLQNDDWVIFFYSTPVQTQEAKVQIKTGSHCTPSCDATQFQYQIGSRATFPASSGYGWVSIENAATEDYGQQVVYRDITLAADGTNNFNWGVVIGNDQEAKIDGFYAHSIKCSSTKFCGATIYGRGDRGIAPVINIEHATISMQCRGNGVRDAAGNTLHLAHSVIQGFNQYGVYYRGGLQGLTVESVYQESGLDCRNPAYNAAYPSGTLVAQAGFITGSDAVFLSDDPIGGAAPGYGSAPGFPAAKAGSTVYHYYVVIESGVYPAASSYGMYYIGDSAGTAREQGDAITVYWPQPNLDRIKNLTYDLLASTESTPPVIGSTATIAVATGLSCSGKLVNGGICTYRDTQESRNSYTLRGISSVPSLNFWPAAVALSGDATATFNKCGQNALWVTPSYMPRLFCQQGINFGRPWQHGITFISYLQGDIPNNPSVGATLKASGSLSGPGTSSVKGLLNFINPTTLGQTDLITLADCNPFLTLATGGYRPKWTRCDTAIGFDSTGGIAPSSAAVYLRAPVSISQYINALPTGSNWLERLTAASKTFNVIVNSASGFQQNGVAFGVYCGTTATCENVTKPLTRTVYGSVSLKGGTAKITGFSPAFTNSSSFLCTGTDSTSAAPVKIVNDSATSITVTGTGTDTVAYICVGT